MESIRNAIEVVTSLEQKYELSVEDTKKIQEQFDDFKVFIPLIGRFSAGKSALINTVLGWGVEVCRENIGVATAIPTEVFYGEEDIACICRPEKEFISMEEYMDIQSELSTKTAEVVKLQLSDNEILEQFPSIALVDMPGLDSGYEVHDKAIEQYIRKSMAYILVFPADELTIPKSMEPILSDLNAYDMPMCVVITKGNRIVGVEEQRKGELKSSLKKYFGNKSIPIFITEKENGRIEEFVQYLASMESRANELGKNYYVKRLEPEFAKICNYLIGYLKNIELSMSELEEQQDKLQNDMKQLNGTVEKELGDFERQIPKIVQEIAMDIQSALSKRMEEFVFDLLHDTDITSALNETVRSALTSSYQTRVMANIRKHLNKISDAMSLGSANYASTMKIDIDKVCGKEISDIGRTAIDVIALLVGGPLGGIIAHVVTGLINKANSEKRREAELKVKQQLTSSVFPAVDKEVRDKVEIDLKHMTMEIRQTVEKDVATQIESLQKSLQEVIQKKQVEDKQKEERKLEITQDLRCIEEIQSSLTR